MAYRMAYLPMNATQIYNTRETADLKYGEKMRILMIFHKGMKSDVKFLVKLHTKSIANEVLYLVNQAKTKDAFDLVYENAEVQSYLPPGKKLKRNPELTLIEE
jgi:hypothetical protein